LNFELFSTGNSFIHTLDPRCKIVVAFLLTIIIAFTNSLSSVLFALVFAILSALVTRIKYSLVLYRLLFINFIIGILWLFIPFSIPGHALWNIGSFCASYEGIYKMFLITFRCNAIILILISYISTIPVVMLGQSLYKMGLNNKLTQLIFLFYRYIDVIYLELQRLLNSLKVRGFNPGSNMHTYRTFANLIGVLLVRSWERAERIYEAMLCRGFTGKYYSLRDFSADRWDICFLICGFVICFIIIALGT
jgi:cobalt/nickel transport system permease protein